MWGPLITPTGPSLAGFNWTRLRGQPWDRAIRRGIASGNQNWRGVRRRAGSATPSLFSSPTTLREKVAELDGIPLSLSYRGRHQSGLGPAVQKMRLQNQESCGAIALFYFASGTYIDAGDVIVEGTEGREGRGEHLLVTSVL